MIINMADTTYDIKSAIKSSLSHILPGENLNNYEIEIVGTAEKGDGFMSDIIFVDLTSKIKNYNFVLKCGKSSEILRKNIPIKEVFEHETYIYKTIFPAFRKFEIEHNIDDDVFDSLAKYYGIFTWQGKEVIVLQNLKPLGYELWDKKLPLPRDYVESILKQYGKWHAISAAMQDQEPDNFKKLVKDDFGIWKEFCISTKFHKAFAGAVETILKIWENEMEEDILNEWKQLRDRTEFYILNSRKKTNSFNVIIHSDAWNNNYMFKPTDDKGKSKEVEVVMIDWQISAFSSPVIDLSYFIYTCISEEDLKDFDVILMTYYTSFAGHLRKLGSDPDKIYTYSNLLNDWKVYARVGIIHAALSFPLSAAETGDIPDIEAAAEKGEDIGSGFCANIKDMDFVKQRSKYIIQHAVERDLIKPTEDF